MPLSEDLRVDMARNYKDSYASTVMVGNKDEDATSTTSGTSTTSRASMQSCTSDKKKKQNPAAKSRNFTSTRNKPNFAAVYTRDSEPHAGKGKGHHAQAASYKGKGGKPTPYHTDDSVYDPWSEDDPWSSSSQSHE